MLGLLLIAGCAGRSEETILYERLGGVRSIYLIVDDFVGRITTDPGIDRVFKDTNLPLIREQLTQMVCRPPAALVPTSVRT